MKVVFADSFWKSLKKIKKHQTWWYKTYELFRYKIPHFIRNIRYFKKELWVYRSWDSVYSLMLLQKSLERTGNTIEKYGHEVDEIRLKKLSMIRRAVELLNNHNKELYIEMAEKELGYEVNGDNIFSDIRPVYITNNDKAIFDLAYNIEQEQWNELWEIIKGREIIPQDDTDPYYAQDGSGIKGWWD